MPVLRRCLSLAALRVALVVFCGLLFAWPVGDAAHAGPHDDAGPAAPVAISVLAEAGHEDGDDGHCHPGIDCAPAAIGLARSGHPAAPAGGGGDTFRDSGLHGRQPNFDPPPPRLQIRPDKATT
ncbi:MAG: hypothetical protein ACU0AT_07975 [Tranquillimonas sp.]